MDDRLEEELRGLLPGLFDTAWEELSQVQPRMTAWLRDTVRAEVDTHADAWLRATSTHITRVRETRARLESLPDLSTPQQSRVPPASPFGTDLARGLTGWLAAAFPIAVWQVHERLVTWSGPIWTVVIFCVIAVVVGFCVYLVNSFSEADLDGLQVMPGVAIAANIGYGLLLWVNLPLTTFWPWVAWIGVGLVLLAADAFIGLWFYDEDEVLELVLITFWALLTLAVTLPGLNPDVKVETLDIAVVGGLGSAAATSMILIPLIRFLLWWRKHGRHRVAEPQGPPPPTDEEFRLDREVRGEEAEALQEWRQAALERAVKPHVQRRIGETLQPPFDQPLNIPIAPGLGQLRAGDFLIATDHFTGIRNSVRLMSGGALGVAGPRGVGKSTLMEAYQIGALADAPRDQIVVLESVPVRYEAREFALHLYARLCEEVAGFAERRGSHRLLNLAPPPWRGWVWLLRGGVTVAVAVLLYVAWVLGVTSLDKQDLPAWLPPAGYPVAVLLAAVVIAGLAAFRLRRRPQPTQAPAIGPDQVQDLQSLRTFAEQRLRRIRFQQHFTEGWSGKLALPGGPELSRTETTQWAEQAMTYPDVIHDFRKFLDRAVWVLSQEESIARPPIAILIDELDKISTPGKASEFINEIKALFSPSVEGCLFVVAVSEDALASFQRRGLPVRDEFDSAFDTIVRVNYLSREDSFGVLRSRVLGLGTEHCSLIYCLAGGLPRDLIRVTRSIVHRQGTGLQELARSVIGEDVRDKAEGLRTVIIQEPQPEPQAGDLIHLIDRISTTSDESLAAEIRAALCAPPAPSDSPAFESLRMETLCHLYFSLTLLDVFDDTLTENRLRSGTASGPQGFDNLARARQLFAVNARASWLAVSAFRTAWGLAPIEQPARKETP